MNKTIKIISVLIIAMMLIMATTAVFATTPEDIGGKIDTSNTDKITDIGGQVLGVIRVIGTIISVGGMLLLGIKYIMGSVEEKAEYKKSFIPYFIGCILLFAASNLAQMIYTWANNI